MRKNQVSIKIERFGDEIPKEIDASQMEIKVYADANNIYEALAAAYYEALTAIGKHEALPSFGCREHTQKAFKRKEGIKGAEVTYHFNSETDEKNN